MAAVITQNPVLRVGKTSKKDYQLQYPHRLNLYKIPPLQEITVEQFEGWAIDRLRILADIEAAIARNKTPEELKTLLTERLNKHLPLGSGLGQDLKCMDLERQKDHYSHFILRLAFCRSEDLRARFLSLEGTLFKLRYETLNTSEQQSFINSLKLGWEEMSPNDPVIKILSRFSKKVGPFFRVPWTSVPDLVERRMVIVNGGYAYVHASQQISLLQAEFNTNLAKSLEITARAIPRLEEDDRLIPILTHLSRSFASGLTSTYTPSTNASGEAISAGMVLQLAKESFPFCMRQMQDTLQTSKHLKHEGRLQYTLFLKGIGLSIEEAIVFWRRSFANMTDDVFNKEYKYNVRHSYGLEGARRNYQPKSCVQIITGKTPGPGESHGCPFRHFSETSLQAALTNSYGLAGAETREILTATKNKHFHIACTRLFEIQHAKLGVKKGDGIGNGDYVDHPNKYFDASRALNVVSKGLKKEEKMEVDL